MVPSGQPGEGGRDRDLEEKLELIRVWLALAEEKLEVAQELLELSRFDDAVSKAYYVMFYSAKAALLAIDVDLYRHSGVVSQFGQHLVKTGYADKRYSRILARAMQAREQERHGRTPNRPSLMQKPFWRRLKRSWEKCLARIHSLEACISARPDELVRGEYTWEGKLTVKIVDVLDEEWFGIANVANQEVSHEGL
jgi:uncharacterized protein (UPF0332 family)